MRKSAILPLAAIVIVASVALALAAGNARKVEPTAEDKILEKLEVFPKDDLWNKDISKEPVDPQSDVLIASAGAAKGLHPDWGTKYGIPFQFVDKKTPRYDVKFQYADECDKGPYPIPDNVQIEGVLSGGKNVDGDRHILCIDLETHKLYELWSCWNKTGKWECGSGAIFDLTKTSHTQRPKGWTSSDAAGLPVFPGLVRFDEVCIKKEITHAVRFTVVKSARGYILPALHFASARKDPNLPPMGMRVRLKADYDISGFPEDCQVILKGLKKYGMILADNGSDWFITGAPDPRWDDESINTLKKVKGKDLEVLKMGPITRG
jgi:hypothetical protein